jgi:hypothetical protein
MFARLTVVSSDPAASSFVAESAVSRISEGLSSVTEASATAGAGATTTGSEAGGAYSSSMETSASSNTGVTSTDTGIAKPSGSSSGARGGEGMESVVGLIVLGIVGGFVAL